MAKLVAPKITEMDWNALAPTEWAGPDDQWVIPGVALCGRGELSEANARFLAGSKRVAEAAIKIVNLYEQGEVSSELFHELAEALKASGCTEE